MAISNKESTGLELRKNAKGGLELFHRGEKLPAHEITYSSVVGQRGVVRIDILTQFIQVVDDAD